MQKFRKRGQAIRGHIDYSPAFQYGHPLSFQLAEKITALTPGNLNHVFFTDSGSEMRTRP